MLADRFWAAFFKQYLGLQTRGKWQTPSPNIEVGMVVMLADPRLPCSSWQTGRVTKVFLGADGQVRTAEVQIQNWLYTRPIADLIVLPGLQDKEENPDSHNGP